MPIHAPCYIYEATIKKWVDGDTVDLIVELGWYVMVRVRCRLDRIDTPERGQVNWAEATAFNQTMAPVGSPVIIYSKLPADKYGRFLVDIYVGGEEPSVNMSLVASGLAELYDGGTR